MNVTFIIRAAGERTEGICRDLIAAQGYALDDIVLVREVPFSAALRKSYQIGIERDKKWTFCVDADVLLRPGSVNTMLDWAEEQDKNVCLIQGFIMDKFFGGPRPGGIHLYRTSLLPLALAQIPVEGIDIRPESFVCNTLKAKGYPYWCVDYISGIHDDYQSYLDIFRKTFVQAFKHGDRFNLFMKIWKEGALNDNDYNVALKGFAAGVAHLNEVYINKDLEIFMQEFKKLGIVEKAPLQAHEVTLDTIEQKILNWKYDDLYRKMFPSLRSISATPLLERKKAPKVNNNSAIRWVKYPINRFGNLVKRMGNKIERLTQ